MGFQTIDDLTTDLSCVTRARDRVPELPEIRACADRTARTIGEEFCDAGRSAVITEDDRRSRRQCQADAD